MLTQAIVKLNDANTASPKISTSNDDDDNGNDYDIHVAHARKKKNNNINNNRKIGDFKCVAEI